MIEKLMKKTEGGISRRELLTGAGRIAAGAALVSVGGFTAFSRADAAGSAEGCLETPTITPSGARYPWPYKRLDPGRAAEIAYENWYKGFCAYAVTSAILGQLQEKVGEPYKSFPYEAFSYGHGGTLGWGTICGTLFAAGISLSLTAGKTGEKILNDVMAWYSESELPIYSPEKPKATFKHVNISGSPLCHISVGKWMDKEGVKFFSPQRKDRCARLAADVAARTVELLNAVDDGKYQPIHGSQAKMHQITAQNNCTDCHGSKVPGIPGI